MKRFQLVCLVFLFGLIACTKEGPEGPAGEDGNANVWSQEFNISSSNWTYYSNAYWESLHLNNSVTEDDLVMVYVQWEDIIGDYNWAALPYTDPDGDYMSYHITEYGWIDLETSLNITENVKVKVVVAENTNAKMTIDWTDYDKVADAFDLD